MYPLEILQQGNQSHTVSLITTSWCERNVNNLCIRTLHLLQAKFPMISDPMFQKFRDNLQCGICLRSIHNEHLHVCRKCGRLVACAKCATEVSANVGNFNEHMKWNIECPVRCPWQREGTRVPDCVIFKKLANVMKVFRRIDIGCSELVK